MSNYELYDSYLNIRSLVSTDTALLLSLLFTYLGAAFILGSKLTLPQRIAITVVYSLGYFQMLYAVYEGMLNMALVVYAWTDAQWRFEFIQNWAYVLAGFWIIVWVVSLAFFMQRKT